MNSAEPSPPDPLPLERSISGRHARALVTALEERDGLTRQHSDRVAALACRVGARCGLTGAELRLLAIAATLHDIGKVGIPDRILLKPGAFVPDEWEIMKTHAVRGERIVRSMEGLDVEHVALAVRHHHERFDGAGYPDRLGGEDIPVHARIVAIVDSYDAQAMPRPYHGARSHAATMARLEAEVGSHFDPALFTCFRAVVADHA